MGVGSQHHTPAVLPPGKSRYPLYRRLGGPQGRSGQVWKISPLTGIRSPDRSARSESLYRLSYPPPLMYSRKLYVILTEWIQVTSTVQNLLISLFPQVSSRNVLSNNQGLYTWGGSVERTVRWVVIFLWQCQGHAITVFINCSYKNLECYNSLT